METLEEFSVSVVAINNTFSAGVTLTQDLASVEIDDNDGRFVYDPFSHIQALICIERLYTMKVDVLGE